MEDGLISLHSSSQTSPRFCPLFRLAQRGLPIVVREKSPGSSGRLRNSRVCGAASDPTKRADPARRYWWHNLRWLSPQITESCSQWLLFISHDETLYLLCADRHCLRCRTEAWRIRPISSILYPAALPNLKLFICRGVHLSQDDVTVRRLC